MEDASRVNSDHMKKGGSLAIDQETLKKKNARYDCAHRLLTARTLASIREEQQPRSHVRQDPVQPKVDIMLKKLRRLSNFDLWLICFKKIEHEESNPRQNLPMKICPLHVPGHISMRVPRKRKSESNATRDLKNLQKLLSKHRVRVLGTDKNSTKKLR